MRPLFVLALAATLGFAEDSRVAQRGAHRMQITLERMEAGAWKAIDPSLVLDKDDRIRFKFKANFAGYLYVTNQSTSSTSTMLFPRVDTGSNNRILANREYVVPATKGAFRVDGPAGYDVVAWLISPVELGRPEAPPAASMPPANMTPRCDDTLFRARGACLDTAAGPQAAKRAEKADDLVFIREKDSSVISSTAPLTSPFVYEFHLAHK
ncbi:MAG TPA: DUF4384 domain-containing protein [Bryobacteraceae bacterium]|nr:DUF4384 domain-containing protein [Bryobacteraceae bacterium]